MQIRQQELHSQQLMHGLGIITATSVIVFITWLLLVPDPYATSNSFEPLRQARISGYLIHPCVYFFLASLTLMNVPTYGGRLWGQVLLLIITHGLMTEVVQYWVPGRACDPLDALANLSGIAVAVAFDRLRRDLFGAYWRMMRLAYID
jgi:VanZ family protein